MASVRASGASVRDSGASVWDSVWASVWDSVGDSVWHLVWDLVGASVRVSVWIYISSLFLKIENLEYIEHKKGINPFQPSIDLWYRGIVPSFDGYMWRLHGGKNMDILWEDTEGVIK